MPTDHLPLPLKVTRIVPGLKQTDVAELAPVTQPNLRHPKRGQPMPRERLERIAGALGIDLAESVAVR